MNVKNSYDVICSYMPERIRAAMQSIDAARRNFINEVRIRINRPVALGFSTGTEFLYQGGKLKKNPDMSNAIVPAKGDIEKIVEALSRFSIHSCARELSEAFFTIENGIRVGISGSYSGGDKKTIKYINSFNFRISRQIIGCSEEIYNKVLASNPHNVLICGGVNSGKTTLLRDLCRICGSAYKCVLIDERNEVSASVSGIPMNNIGIQTDVLEGCCRSDGIITAVRNLSPDIIFCDEISSEHDAEAIVNGYGCGVNFVATIHASSFEELKKRKIATELMKTGIFNYAVMLNKLNPGKINAIRRISAYD